jgi:NADH-ubiquinone oxidoreductase chain 1
MLILGYTLVVFVVVSWVVNILLILLSVAFFTLFERKVMGLFHIRLGPNKVSFVGVVQPLLDAVKLLRKQNLTPQRSNKFVYNISPQRSLVLAVFVWVTMPLFYSLFNLGLSFLMFYCLSSIMVFFVLVSGWSSNSKYSLIGRLRSIAQSVSYEVVISTIVLVLCVFVGYYSISSFLRLSSILFVYFLLV